MKVVKGDGTVVHLPYKFYQKVLYFLGLSGEIIIEVTGYRRHCKQLCRAMEVRFQLESNCSNKEQMKRLKELVNLYLLKDFQFNL